MVNFAGIIYSTCISMKNDTDKKELITAFTNSSTTCYMNNAR